MVSYFDQGRTQGCGSSQTAASQTFENRNLRNIDFVHMITSNVLRDLRDLPFRRDPPVKSADV
jgi:hypothetical protein